MPAKTREYFYTIDASGRLFHDGTELTDERFLDFFYKRLGPNESGRHNNYAYLSPCGPEQNYVRATEYPLVFRRIADLELYYAPSLTVPLQPDALRSSPGGRLLHPAPVGGFAPFSAGLTLELTADAREWGPYLALPTSGLVGYGWTQPHRELVVEPLEPPDALRLLRPKEENRCFACGGAHPGGLGLTFLWNEGKQTAETWLTPDERLQGSHGWMHGGFISLLLDEVMGKVLSGMGIRAPTANLNVDFRRPVRLGRRLHLLGTLERVEGRKHFLRGSIVQSNPSSERRTDERHELARGAALFVSPRVG